MPAEAGGGLEMYLAKYLLSIEEFMEKEKGEALMERAFLCVDETRRRRTEGMRPGRARAATLGAGLLLQLAVREACAFEESGDRRPVNRDMDSSMNGSANADSCGDMGGGADGDMRGVSRGMNGGEGADNGRGINGSVDGTRRSDRGSRNGTMAGQKANEDGKAATLKWGLRRYSAAQLLAYIESGSVLPLAYKYGENGKPYFTDLPFYFNLSHSGDYVLCVLAMEEIGADIQRQEGKDVKKLAGRFYSPDEAAAIERAEEAGGAGEKLFYRLWARKEAYGKLTGRGVAAVLKEDFLPFRDAFQPEGIGAFSQNAFQLEGGVLLSRDAVQPERAGTSSRAGSSCDGRTTLPGITDLPDGSHLIWEECDMEDYSIAICRYG